MSRNLREEDYTFKPVSEYEVAPHRYLWSGMDDSYLNAESWSAFRAGCPYKDGDVVYLDVDGQAVKALITNVYPDRDRYGDRREKFKVHFANKTGDRFAKNWRYAYPGQIQRGYKLAGLAPDVV